MDDKPDDEKPRDADLHARLVEAAYSPASSADEARTALAALARLRAIEAERTLGRDDAGVRVAVDPDESAASPPVPSQDSPQPRPFAQRHRFSLVAGAVLVAVAVGAALGLGTGSKLGVTESATSSAGSRTPPRTAPGALGFSTSVLKQARDRVQVPTDALPQPLRNAVDPSTSRLLYDDDPASAGTAERWRLWVATGDNPRQLCYLSSFDNVHDALSCVPLDQAFSGRYVVSQSTPEGSFEALIVDGAVAVQVD